MKKIFVIKDLDYKNKIIDNFLSKKECAKIIKELNKVSKFDDVVMGGRHRINKGSLNFKRFIKKSKNSRNFFNKLNNKNFYQTLSKKFEKMTGKYFLDSTQIQQIFSKTISGSQKGNLITSQKTDTKKNIVYLDMDFSISEKGYSRGPHVDRDSRVFNFLIYLNDLTKKDGARLELYNIKKKIVFKNKRFLPEKKLKLVKYIKPKAGKIVFFESTPNSYHSVTNFYAKKTLKRYFIYGSYSLNKKVLWNTSQ
tara:strand:+ start:1372 stop:2127 length:756 start_codon:yes stop_codon:yes gene_type:complete